jgi:hypothetical protein
MGASPHDPVYVAAGTSAAEWIAAVGTALAFLIAAIAFAAEARRRAWAQARLVYAVVIRARHLEDGEQLDVHMDGASVGMGDAEGRPAYDAFGNGVRAADGRSIVVTVAVLNESDELLGVTLVRPVAPVTGRPSPWNFEVPGGPVPPHGEYRVALLCKDDPRPNIERAVGVEVTFRDSAGRWWRRRNAEPVKRARDKERDTRRGDCKQRKAVHDVERKREQEGA